MDSGLAWPVSFEISNGSNFCSRLTSAISFYVQVQFHAKYPLIDSQSEREFAFSYAILFQILHFPDLLIFWDFYNQVWSCSDLCTINWNLSVKLRVSLSETKGKDKFMNFFYCNFYSLFAMFAACQTMVLFLWDNKSRWNHGTCFMSVVF